MPEVLDRTEEARQVPPSTMLIEKIGVVRRKRVQTAAGTGLSMVVGTVVLVLGMGMVLDWWLDFPGRCGPCCCWPRRRRSAGWPGSL